MRLIAGEQLRPGNWVHVAADGTAKRMRFGPFPWSGRPGQSTRKGDAMQPEMPGYDVVLGGGPADGMVLRFDHVLPEVIQLKGGWRPVDALNGVLEEYVTFGKRDDEGRMMYWFRRQRYTAEGGTWEAV